MGASRGLQDNIPALVRASNTTCSLAATNAGQSTRITIGGQQYRIASTLTLTIPGSLDIGTFSVTHELYYVYAVASTAGVVTLVASLAGPSTGPAGSTGRYTLVGAIYATDASNVIGSTVAIIGPATTDFRSFVPTFVAMGTVTIHYAEWRRDGDTIQIRARWVTGTITGSVASMALPAGITLTAGAQSRPVGECKTNNTQNLNVLENPPADLTNLYFGQNTAANSFTAIVGTTIGTGITCGMFATVKANGWSQSLT